jgi:hypothetical protein
MMVVVAIVMMFVIVGHVNLMAIDMVKVVTAVGIVEDVVPDGLMAMQTVPVAKMVVTQLLKLVPISRATATKIIQEGVDVIGAAMTQQLTITPIIPIIEIIQVTRIKATKAIPKCTLDITAKVVTLDITAIGVGTVVLMVLVAIVAIVVIGAVTAAKMLPMHLLKIAAMAQMKVIPDSGFIQESLVTAITLTVMKEWIHRIAKSRQNNRFAFV